MIAHHARSFHRQDLLLKEEIGLQVPAKSPDLAVFNRAT
jgi:hypothetical protein